MALICNIILICLLVLIAIEDFRFFAVSWVLFPAVFLVASVSGIYSSSHLESFLIFTLLNICIIGVQVIGIILYAFIKRGTWRAVREMIGLGDFLFLIAISPLMHPFSFVLFCISTLILTFCVLVVQRKTHQYIPLAGYFSLSLIAFLIIGIYYPINPLIQL